VIGFAQEAKAHLRQEGRATEHGVELPFVVEPVRVAFGE